MDTCNCGVVSSSFLGVGDGETEEALVAREEVLVARDEGELKGDGAGKGLTIDEDEEVMGTMIRGGTTVDEDAGAGAGGGAAMAPRAHGAELGWVRGSRTREKVTGSKGGQPAV